MAAAWSSPGTRLQANTTNINRTRKPWLVILREPAVSLRNSLACACEQEFLFNDICPASVPGVPMQQVESNEEHFRSEAFDETFRPRFDLRREHGAWHRCER